MNPSSATEPPAAGASGDAVVTMPEQLDERIQHEQSAVANAAPAEADDAEEALRREVLRKKGAEFLEMALEASGKGEDPFIVTPAEPFKARQTRKTLQKDEPDVIAFGQALKEAKLYVFMAIYLIGTAASPVLIKRSFVAMQTPAVLTFLHMLSVVLALWIANHFNIFKLELNGMTVRGSAVRSTLTSLQMLCSFSALHHNSVNLVLVWTFVGGAVVDMGMPILVHGFKASPDLRQTMTAALAAGVLEILMDRDKVPVGFLMMSLWIALKVAEWWWKQIKADASLGGRISDLVLSTRMHQLSDEEDAVDAPTMAFFQNALPAAPILILGFIAQEGKELVDHELSVPAVRTMLMACLCYTTSTCSLLVLANRISADMKMILKSIAVAGTITFFFMDEVKTISWFAVLLTAVSVGAAQAAQLLYRSNTMKQTPV